jgi:hypothetical protein
MRARALYGPGPCMFGQQWGGLDFKKIYKKKRICKISLNYKLFVLK